MSKYFSRYKRIAVVIAIIIISLAVGFCMGHSGISQNHHARPVYASSVTTYHGKLIQHTFKVAENHVNLPESAMNHNNARADRYVDHIRDLHEYNWHVSHWYRNQKTVNYAHGNNSCYLVTVTLQKK